MDSAKHFRPLLSADKYAAYIPAPSGTRVLAGNGNTFFSLREMAKVARKHKSQAAKIASQLEGKSLEETVRNIKDFLYNNFQYKADDSDQNLFTLARAWKERQTGIDCKSYSIIASQILLTLNIPHAFRKIRQNGDAPKMYSHVYVIVYNGTPQPFIIDGVASYNSEPPHLEKYDLVMKHYVLNGVAASPATNTYGNSLSGTPTNGLGFIDPVTIRAVVSVGAKLISKINFSNIKCWGSSTDVGKLLNELLIPELQKLSQWASQGRKSEMLQDANYWINNRRQHLASAKSPCTAEAHQMVIDVLTEVVQNINRTQDVRQMVPYFTEVIAAATERRAVNTGGNSNAGGWTTTGGTGGGTPAPIVGGGENKIGTDGEPIKASFFSGAQGFLMAGAALGIVGLLFAKSKGGLNGVKTIKNVVI